MIFDKKLSAIKNRVGLNIKSGRVMIEVKDRDWLLSTVELLQEEVLFLEMKNEELRGKLK